MAIRVLSLLLGFALASPAAAQDAFPTEPAENGQDPPFYVAVIDGSASLTRNGQTESVSANVPLIEGDRLRTERGRLELRDDRGAIVYVDEESLLDLSAPNALRLLGGQVRLVVREGAGDRATRIDSPNATILPAESGDYRVAVSVGPRGDETVLVVFEGSAELSTERGSSRVSAGERSTAYGVERPTYPARASTYTDEFDRWVAARLDVQQPTASASYVPDNLAPYSAVLDQYGSWQPEQPYGYVWYPSVAVGWRPYSHGYWGHAGFYGWFWIGHDPWAWATHHYGRWGWRGNRWFWIPGPVWGPAWVSWGIGPGYVGWCPLGWDNRPVFWLSSPHVSYYRGGYDHYRRYDGYRAGHVYAPHHGWTVLPSRHFRPGVPVGRHSVDLRSVPAESRAAFVTQRVGPPRGRPLQTAPAASAAGRWVAPPTHYGVPRSEVADTGMAGRRLTVGSAGTRESPAARTPSTGPPAGPGYGRPGYAVPRASDAVSPYERAGAVMARPSPGRTGVTIDRSGSTPPPARSSAPAGPGDAGRAVPRHMERSAPPPRSAPSRGAQSSGASAPRSARGSAGSAPRSALPRGSPRR